MDIQIFTTPTVIFVGPTGASFPHTNMAIINPQADTKTVSGKVCQGETIDEAARNALKNFKESVEAAEVDLKNAAWVLMEVDCDEAWGKSKKEYVKFFVENGIIDWKPARSTTQVTTGDQKGYYARFEAIFATLNPLKESNGKAEVIISGQAADDLETDIIKPGTVAEQMAFAFENVELLAAPVFESLKDLSKMVISIKDFSKQKEITEAYNVYLTIKGVKTIVAPIFVQSVHDADYEFLLTPTFTVTNKFTFGALGQGIL